MTDPFVAIIGEIHRLLGQPLPGPAAQNRMSPRPDTISESAAGRAPCPRQAAVLLLLYPRNGGPHFVLIQRPHTMPYHAGQIGLPGGGRKRGESLEETALRETEEEIGVDRAYLTIHGTLTPLFVPPSNFCITPLIAHMPSPGVFKPCPSEVSDVLEVPTAALLDKQNVFQERRSIGGRELVVPYYRLANHKVWGATAMILSEFERLLHRIPKV